MKDFLGYSTPVKAYREEPPGVHKAPELIGKDRKAQLEAKHFHAAARRAGARADEQGKEEQHDCRLSPAVVVAHGVAVVVRIDTVLKRIKASCCPRWGRPELQKQHEGAVEQDDQRKKVRTCWSRMRLRRAERTPRR